MSVGAVAAGVGAVATVYSASQAGAGADAQIAGANAANQVSQAQFNQTQLNNAPFLRAGTTAVNNLAYRLGLSRMSGLPGTNLDAPDREVIRRQYEAERMGNGVDVAYGQLNAGDQAAYQQEVDRRYNAALGQYEANQEKNGTVDSNYGSLTRQFSTADLANDVPYQLGYDYAQQQGATGVNRLAAAGGSLNSGATLKALQDRGVQVANQYAGDAYNRFTNDQTNTYNRLAGLSGSGQTAANNVSQAGAANASSIGNNLVGIGNARAAASVGAGNALTSGANSISNYYQQNQLLNALNKNNQSNYNGYVGNAYSNGFGNAFTNMNDPAYG